METDRLKYFCVIAETGSLTAAAEILNISHSGLSKAMTVLQDELNQKLFRPQGRGIELTERGRETYEKSKALLESVDRLRSGSTPGKKRLSIGMAEIFALHLSGEIARDLHNENFDVDLHEADSGEAEMRILDGKIDFAISFVPFPHRDLEYLKIKTVQMGVFFLNPGFKNRPLHEIPFVVPNSEIKNNPLSIRSRDGWPADQPRNSIYGASSLSIAMKIVDAGLAAMFIPKFLARPGLHEFEVKKSLFQHSERDIFIVKKANADESRVMKLIGKCIRLHC